LAHPFDGAAMQLADARDCHAQHLGDLRHVQPLEIIKVND
jgi:hypothetical protein